MVGCTNERGAAPPVATDHAVEQCDATLSFEDETAHPGGTVRGVLRLSIAGGWHTYADPPGDSGMPPLLSLETASGQELETGPFDFPPPETFKDVVGVTYGYEGTVELPFSVTLPERAAGPLAIKGTVEWLICRDICLPVTSTVDARLDIVASPRAD
jgi:thiol:disulfide interchange protein DsbD